MTLDVHYALGDEGRRVLCVVQKHIAAAYEDYVGQEGRRAARGVKADLLRLVDDWLEEGWVLEEKR